MLRRKYSIVRAVSLMSIALALFLSDAAEAAPLQGRLANGTNFSGQYVVIDGRDDDGLLTHIVRIEGSVANESKQLKYEYAADDFPSVALSSLGYILVLVHSGGMEGRISYNYVTVLGHELVSIGVVQMQLHLGKVESIDVQSNQNLNDVQINKLVRDGFKFNLSMLGDSRNAYQAAALLLLARGKFIQGNETLNLIPLVSDKEISSDAFLLAKIEGIMRINGMAGEVPSGSNYRIVGVDRAYFFSSPSSLDVEKSYLIKGDRVSLVKRSNDRRYWLVDYISKTGRKTEKWLSCEAIDYCN